MANHWLQTKRYTCTGCGANLLHDKMHGHVSFDCPARPRRVPRPAKRMVLIEKVYEPRQN